MLPGTRCTATRSTCLTLPLNPVGDGASIRFVSVPNRSMLIGTDFNRRRDDGRFRSDHVSSSCLARAVPSVCCWFSLRLFRFVVVCVLTWLFHNEGHRRANAYAARETDGRVYRVVLSFLLLCSVWSSVCKERARRHDANISWDREAGSPEGGAEAKGLWLGMPSVAIVD